MKTLGQRIRAARKAAGLTQQALAGTDFTPGFISQLENGVVHPSLRSLEVLARRLGKPLGYFLADSDAGRVWPQLDLAERLLEAGHVAEAAEVLAPLRTVSALQTAGVRARRLLGILMIHSGEPEAALTVLREALTLAQGESPEEQARIHNGIAGALDRMHRWKEAEAHLSQALTLINSAEEADPLLRMKVETNLAIVLCRLGRYEECQALGTRLLQGSRRVGLTYRLSELLHTLGVASFHTGHLETALWYYRLARGLYQVFGDDPMRAGVLQNEGLALQELGQYREACGVLEEAGSLYRQLGMTDAAAAVAALLARVCRDGGEMETARRWAQQAVGWAKTPGRQAAGREELARLLEACGDWEAACREYEVAAALYEEAGDRSAVARMARALGTLLTHCGRGHEALPWFEKAIALFGEVKG